VTRTVFSKQELRVLTLLNERSRIIQETSTSEISEIANLTGIKSNEEVQRALFILEGKALVRPDPAGDLTSNFWKITTGGVKALQLMQV